MNEQYGADTGNYQDAISDFFTAVGDGFSSTGAIVTQGQATLDQIRTAVSSPSAIGGNKSASAGAATQSTTPAWAIGLGIVAVGVAAYLILKK